MQRFEKEISELEKKKKGMAVLFIFGKKLEQFLEHWAQLSSMRCRSRKAEKISGIKNFSHVKVEAFL